VTSDEILSIGAPIPQEQSIAWPRDYGRARLPLINHSNKAITLYLRGEDPDQACRFEFLLPGEANKPAGAVTLTLAPQQALSLPVIITPPLAPLLGLNPKTYHFTFTLFNLSQKEGTRAALGQIKSKAIIGPGSISVVAICLIVLLIPLYRFIENRAVHSSEIPRAAAETSKSDGLWSLLNRGVEQSASQKPQPAPSDLEAMTYEAMFKEVGAAYNLDWRMLATMAYQESYLDPMAVGALQEMGLMQILPATWNIWAPKAGVSDPFDPYSNLQVSATYQAYLKDYFTGKGYPGDEWMLAAYNWGPENVLQVIESGADWGDVPPHVRRYALKIMKTDSHPVLSDPRLQEPVDGSRE